MRGSGDVELAVFTEQHGEGQPTWREQSRETRDIGTFRQVHLSDARTLLLFKTSSGARAAFVLPRAPVVERKRTLHLNAPAHYDATIVDTSGKPIRGARVAYTLIPLDEGSPTVDVPFDERTTTTSGPDGHVMLETFHRQRLRVSIDAEGFLHTEHVLDVDGTVLTGELRVERRAEISGRISNGAKVLSARVLAARKDGQTFEGTIDLKTARFSVSVGEGAWDVAIMGAGQAWMSPKPVVSGPSHRVDLGAVQLLPSTNVRGTVTADGEPSALSEVVLKRRAITLRTYNESDGTFEFADVPAGDWSLNAEGPDGKALPHELALTAGVKEDVTVPVFAASLLSFDGRVVDEKGRPVSGARVWAASTSGDVLDTPSAVTASNGSFSVRVPGPAPVTLYAASDAGVQSTASDVESDPAHIQLQLEPMARVTFRTVDREDHPVAGVAVDLEDKGDNPMPLIRVRTDGEGRASFPVFRSGRISLSVAEPLGDDTGWASLDGAPEVSGGGAETVLHVARESKWRRMILVHGFSRTEDNDAVPMAKITVRGDVKDHVVSSDASGEFFVCVYGVAPPRDVTWAVHAETSDRVGDLEGVRTGASDVIVKLHAR